MPHHTPRIGPPAPFVGEQAPLSHNPAQRSAPAVRGGELRVQVAGRAVHALFWIEGIAHPQRARRGRNRPQPAGQMMCTLGAREGP